MPCRTYVQDVLFDLHNILKYENINLLAKIAQNLQIFKHSTNRSRSHTHACNTGFEGSEHIVFIQKSSDRNPQIKHRRRQNETLCFAKENMRRKVLRGAR